MANIWSAIRGMIAPELTRFRKSYQKSPRLPILESMHAAAVAEDAAALCRAGHEFLRLTGVAPPGCYVILRSEPSTFFLAGERVRGRKRGIDCEVYYYHPQVWR
jgi:hypothetical protein